MASVSKEEYLKRYLSNDAARAKQKKKIKQKNAVRKANVRIIDDDADLKTLKSTADGVDVSDDEAPTVAEIIDERPQHVRRLEEYRNTGRWKVLGENNSRNDIVISKDYGVTSAGGIVAGDNVMADTKSACYSHSTYSGKRHIDSDLDTPPRANRHQLVSDQSQRGNRRHDTDSDSSPSHKSNGANKKSSQNSVLTGKIQPKQNSDSYHLSQQYKGNSNNLPVRMKRHGNDSDPSSIRKQRHDSDFDHSPIRKPRHDSDSDHSPVRKQRHDSDFDHSPIRKQRHDSDSDHSLGRKQRCDSDFDCSPVRKQRHDSNSDHSPVRKQRYGNDSHHSPIRKRGLNNASDQSVPRRQLENCSHQSPGRRYKNDCDPSPPRIRKEESDSDQSPPRRRKRESDSDQSPPRKRKGGSDSDQSPPRKGKGGSDSDQSPPRKRQVEIDSNCSTTKNIWNEKNLVKPSKTLGGAKAGLSTAKEMKQESDTLRRKEDKMFSMIDKNELGKDAKTVFRDKSGKRKDLAAEKEKEEEELKKAAEKDKKYKEWGQGLKQKEMKDENIQDYIHEMSKPLARYKDDEDLDKIMREMEREGDPMAAFMKKKSKNDDSLNAKPRYRGPPPPPNRFGILPGYRWDGVDRSNGFERKIFAKMADKKAIKEQAYKWSIEDM